MGVVYGLNGDGFFRYIRHHIKDLMNEAKIDTIYFNMMVDTYEYLRHSLEGVATTFVIRSVKVNDRDMLEVKLELV
jgi:hypothetical protein